jgi:chromosome segregation ATPase
MHDPREAQAYLKYLQRKQSEIQAAAAGARDAFGAAWTACRHSRQQCAELGQVLRALRLRIQEHFQEEESDGCLEEAVSRCPSLAAEFAQLMQEHKRLLQALDALIRDCDEPQCTRDAQRLAECRASFEGFLTLLQDHEARESALLCRGLNLAESPGGTSSRSERGT